MGKAALGLLIMIASQASATEIWLSGVDPYVRQIMRPGESSDYTALFTPSAPWEQAAKAVNVFATSTQWIINGPNATLATMFSDLRRRHIALAAEALMLPGQTCGAGVEGYSAPGSMALLAKRIKSLGGELDYVVMDEPLWFGHHYNGPNACRTTIPDLAAIVASSVHDVRAVFPNAKIGDVEPLSLTTVPNWLEQLLAFASAYEAITRTKLNFIHADVQWTGSSSADIQRFISRVREAGIKTGLIYNGDPTDEDDLAWTQRAEARFGVAVPAPDHAVLQTWMPHPAHMLPETEPGTMTYLVNRYVSHR